MDKRYIESVLVDLCQEVLGVADAPLDASFFDLGGDSLQSMYFVVRLGEELRCPVRVRALYESPTLENLALILESSEPTPRAAPTGEQADPLASLRALARDSSVLPDA